MSQRLRILFETEPNTGAWNMAVDESLLENALKTGDAVLRWYRWREPTLSLGYFQKGLDSDPAFNSLPVVRRLSGGGAILHHHEWTYSCTLPPSHPLTQNPHDLYLLIHGEIIRTLSHYGFETCMRGGEHASSHSDPFLCFQRGDSCDVLCGEHKILGSAQRRRRGAVLQHGSLILRSSCFAPHIPGLYELAGIAPDELDLANSLCESVAKKLVFPVIRDNLTALELELAGQLSQSRYLDNLDWNRQSPSRKSPD